VGQAQKHEDAVQADDGRARLLPRGGVVIDTAEGPIQYGVPPETIKDNMRSGEKVPTHYLVPRSLFLRRVGINVAEIEFPAYYNFFFLKRPVNIITDKGQEMRLRLVMQESLFGPPNVELEHEVEAGFPRAALPDLAKELAWFRKHPFDPSGRPMQVDDLVSFSSYDKHGVARIGCVEIHRLLHREGYRIVENGATIAHLGEEVPMPHREEVAADATNFCPPQLGVTLLGSSHGFDPHGRTTGFVLWVGGRGILVDPPVDSTHWLRRHGIPPKIVDAVILSHCHADHDAGTFQKVLEESKINIYTTPTVLGTFLRKYSALSELSLSFLRRLFRFRPVTIGAPIRIHGAEFHFFYSLHSIPTIGFEMFYGGKSIVFSGDTLHEPEKIHMMHKEGVMSDMRRDRLLDFPWERSLILHEAGVPPIHTKASFLATLPDSIKKRLRLVHIAEKDVPGDSGLSLAHPGIDNTIELTVEASSHIDPLEALSVLAEIDLFRGLYVEKAAEFLSIVRRETYKEGTVIFRKGDLGTCFRMIASGEVAILDEEVFFKSYRAGDYFGETAIVTHGTHRMTAVAKTDVVLYEVDRCDFLNFLRGTDIVERIVRLAENRNLRTWELFTHNTLLADLTTAQKTQLQAYLEWEVMTAGEALWERGTPPDAAYLIDRGEGVLIDDEGHEHVVSSGALVGEFDVLRTGHVHRTAAYMTSSAVIYRISKEDWSAYCRQNPGILLAFIGTHIVD
jgi:CRP-like cAMP-binding protein/glyoxylase-like metal-dependent hydrolase (beta-lactamase superfamily II)